MRVISMEMGCDIVNVFKRFVDLCNQVESSMRAESGTTFAHSAHLGYILTCPSNLGTGERLPSDCPEGGCIALYDVWRVWLYGCIGCMCCIRCIS